MSLIGAAFKVMQLLPPPTGGGHQLCLLQHVEMLGDRLPGHAHAGAELTEGEPVVLVEPVQQPAPGGVAQRPEDRIHLLHRTIRLVIIHATIRLHDST